MITKLFRFFFFIILIAALIMAYAFLSKDKNRLLKLISSLPIKKSIDKTEITYKTPFIGDINLKISSTATIEPQNRLEIKPPINGRIEEILVKEGDKVKKNQILAWMSSTERTALIDISKIHGDKESKYWQEVYKPTPLISPIDGDVIVSEMKPGQTVTSGTSIMVLSDRLIVKAQIDETDIGNIKKGMVSFITFDSYPDESLNGIVEHISYESKVVNNVTIYDVDIIPEKIPEFFRSGMSANIEIKYLSKTNITLIPLNVIKQEDNKNFVNIIKKGSKETIKQYITTGISDDKNVEVISGLSLTDKIAVEEKKFTGIKRKAVNPFMPSRRENR